MHHHDPQVLEHDDMGSPQSFLATAFVLFLLTGVEVSCVLVFKLPTALRVGILLCTACLKATLIGAYYMNLKYERLAMAYLVIIPLAALALVLFWGVVPDAARLFGLR
jgi:cytochrome c oxidase subunit IV